MLVFGLTVGCVVVLDALVGSLGSAMAEVEPPPPQPTNINTEVALKNTTSQARSDACFALRLIFKFKVDIMA